MHVGSVGAGWGASRLWHDPNYEITRDYRPIPVQKGIESGEALPHEEHLLPPEKPQDPYSVQESAYDVAAAQMTRGVEAQKLLQGQKNEKAFDAAVTAAQSRDRIANDVTRTMMVNQAIAQNPEAPGAVVKPQQPAPLPSGQPVKPAGSSSTAAERESQRAAQDARDSSEIVDAVALGAGGVLSVAAAAKATALAGASAAGAAGAVAASAPAATTAATAAQLNTRDDGTVDPNGSKKQQG